MANNLAAFEAETWSNRLVRNIDQVNVMKNLVNTDWEGDLRQSKTVKVRTLGSVSMADYAGSITYQDLAPVEQDFTVAGKRYFAFNVDDVEAAQNDINALDGYTRRAGVAMNNDVESKILSPYASALAANKLTGAAGAPIAMDSSGTADVGVYPIIAKLAELLSNQSVPEIGRWLIVNPTVRSLLWLDTLHFIRASDLGDSIVMSGRFDENGNGTPANRAPGFIGQILGFDVYMVTHLPSDSNGKYMVAGNRDAITYAAQIVKIEALRLQSAFADAVRGLLLHDATVFDETSKCLATAYFSN